MDPAQGETQGKSITSKLKAKVKGVKGKVHLPGHKKRQGGGGGEDEQGGDSSSGYSSDDSPKKPGPETGYNVGASTPFTTVRATPLSPARQAEKKPPSSYEEPPRSFDTHSTTESMAKMGHDEDMSRPREGVLGKVKDTVGGAAAAVGNTMGYYTEVDRTPVQPAPPADPNAPTMVEKAMHSLGLDKPADSNAPTMVGKAKHTLGLDKPADPNAPTMMEKVLFCICLLLLNVQRLSLVLCLFLLDGVSFGDADRIGEERTTVMPPGGYNQGEYNQGGYNQTTKQY